MKNCIIIDKATDRTFCPYDGKFFGPIWTPIYMTKGDALSYLDEARQICPDCEILEDNLTANHFPTLFDDLNNITL